MKNLLVLFLLTSGFCTSAFAWKETGGGDEVGLEFQRAYAAALQRIASGEVSLEVDQNKLKAVAESARVIIVDEQLFVSFGSEVQDSVAINDRAMRTVRVQRARWKGIKDPRVQEAIALHEMLSLAGIESTGVYKYSADYLQQIGLSPWLVSGGPDGAIEKPVAKDLVCEIRYFPSGLGRYQGEQLYPVGPIRLKEDSRGRQVLSARQTVTTKDGRFTIDIWAFQPYRTPTFRNPVANIALVIDDHKNHLSVQRGSNFGSGFEYENLEAELFYNFDNQDPEKSGDILTSCKLR
ncbi:MAG: hypothetical protein EOP11_09860 [Proteobacteria bacterium]|nr:MAG: hypothetical protein EOP11_09860 [Pseudomonadota bacterium]